MKPSLEEWPTKAKEAPYPSEAPYPHHLDLSDSSPNSWYILLREVPCMTPVIARATLHCTDSNFSQKDSFWGWQGLF